MRARHLTAGLLTAALLGTVGIAAADQRVVDRAVLWAPTPPAAGLITDDRAYFTPQDARLARSPDWHVTSGTLTSTGTAYATNSPIFRTVSRRADFADVSVRAKVTVHQLAGRGDPWDGVHLFLRYQHEAHLYYASIARRDGAIVVKKKCPGGPSNGGTYYTLGVADRRFPPAFGQAKWYSAWVRTLPDRSVQIGVERIDQPVLTVTDRGQGCPAITAPGRIGVRADNALIQFAEFRARQQ